MDTTGGILDGRTGGGAVTRYDEFKYWCPFHERCANGEKCTKALNAIVRSDFRQQGKFPRQYSNPPVSCYTPKETQ